MEHLSFELSSQERRTFTLLSSENFSKKVESEDTKILSMPRKLFHPERILIMKILVRHGQVDFRELKQALDTTEGNLASHLRALEQEGYVSFHKHFEGRRPRTSLEATPAGVTAF